jgi:hypothetical protein
MRSKSESLRDNAAPPFHSKTGISHGLKVSVSPTLLVTESLHPFAANLKPFLVDLLLAATRRRGGKVRCESQLAKNDSGFMG